jgi:hypothetical protein
LRGRTDGTSHNDQWTLGHITAGGIGVYEIIQRSNRLVWWLRHPQNRFTDA